MGTPPVVLDENEEPKADFYKLDGEPVQPEVMGPFIPVILAFGAALSFGIRSMILKYLGMKEGVDGISASVIFLGVDGCTGSLLGLIAALSWNTFEGMPYEHLALGVISGFVAGLGVVNINIAVSIG